MDIRRKQLKLEQKGMVSIVVTILIMLVLSLIVISFARNSRREQRQALDRQLSTQAFYAAETGVNDAVAYVKANPGYTKSDCVDNPALGNPTLNAASKVKYTCVLIDPGPQSLEYKPVEVTKSQVVLLQNTALDNIQSIKIVWNKHSAAPPTPVPCNNPASVTFPADSAWPNNCPGILRVDLVPVGGSSLTRSGLATATMTNFFFPVTSGASTIPYHDNSGPFSAQGDLTKINCVASPQYVCTVTVSGLAGLTSNKYALRLLSIYDSTDVIITATDVNGAVRFKDGQTAIDVTGKAGDVLRRVSARVPSNDSLKDGVFPSYGILSVDTLCKRFSVYPNNYAVDSSLSAADRAACDVLN